MIDFPGIYLSTETTAVVVNRLFVGIFLLHYDPQFLLYYLRCFSVPICLCILQSSFISFETFTRRTIGRLDLTVRIKGTLHVYSRI